MVHYYGRAMANAHCALYINIWFHIMLCNSVTKYFSLHFHIVSYYNIFYWLVLLSGVGKFKEVQLSVSSIHCPLSSTVQHPIKYDSLAEHGAVQRSMLFIAKLSFVQFSAVLCRFCSFVQFSADLCCFVLFFSQFCAVLCNGHMALSTLSFGSSAAAVV